VRFVMIAIGGALGSLARYGLTTWVQARVPLGFPWGTFLVNVSGCLAMGVAATIVTERLGINPQWRYLVPIGFLGAYTTFATFEFEGYLLNTNGVWATGLLYLIASVVVGYLAMWTGIAIARLL
jgi:CrcB protein